MKKILSFVLVLAMIASMMCVSVSAAEFANGQKGELVGSHTGGTGVDKFEAQTNSTTVSANISSVTINKYALDLEYSISDITLDGQSVWNVNTLKYDANGLTLQIGDGTAAAPDNEEDYTIGTIKLTNYSDLGLDVEIEMSMLDANVPITGSVTRTDKDITEFDVAGAYTGAEQDKAVEANYVATINSTDWARAAAQLNLKKSASVDIATITFKVQPATEAHRVNPAQDAGTQG